MAKVTDYKRLSPRDHVLKRPNTYVGSIETTEDFAWMYDAKSEHMQWSCINYNPGLYKIFDEVVVNARDEFIRSITEAERTPVKHIDITITGNGTDDEPLTITVANDGDGILIEEHPEEKMWLPQLIFGYLNTSSNYDDEEKERVVGGLNGLGAKLTNLFSNTFSIEVKDIHNKKHYTQLWTDNMATCEKPSIKKFTGSKGGVSITFEPDLSRFCKDTKGKPTKHFIRDMISVFHTRAIELAAVVGSKAKVSWNDEVITTNTFEKYAKLFLRDGATTIAYENCGPRWEVAAVMANQLYTDDEHGIPDKKHISVVNGISTKKGGKHVDYVSKQILDEICALALKKKKITIKPGQIKDSIVFFVNSTIVNPEFTSQCKEELTTNASKFGSKPEFAGKLVDGLVKLGALDEALAIHEAKNNRDSKKTDGKKRQNIRGLPKLEDAHFAGGPKSCECTLILTEGDSAATSAIAGLQVVGSERWGVFPLRGKLLNVKDITVAKFNANEELTAIKRIIGLKQGTKYTSLKELRYGRIMIMADQDYDGSHIKGLVMNLFHTEWPELLKMGFICSLLTPILKATKGKNIESFYTQAAFEEWKQKNETKGWTIKYYKGLGTSTPTEAKEWFHRLNEVQYEWDDETNDSIHLAFNKKRADDRKDWLASFDSKRQIQIKDKKASYTDFVNDELIHFSNADNIRSLPSIMDGLKPSQRKILYCCFKRNLRSEIKVAQLAGYVSEHAAYHHGEASLNSTITSMGQNFVGSNNINLLVPAGQFGSRLQGGKDAASPRYIHTHIEPIVDKIFKKEDNTILKYLDDDGYQVEPEFYLPIIPYIAINGCIGIGTGFSTSIPSYNPAHIVSLLRARLTDRIDTIEGRQLDPWWFGFKGRISRRNDNTWITHGIYEFNDEDNTVVVTELPIGRWANDYKAFLDAAATAEEEAKAVNKKEERKAKRSGKGDAASVATNSTLEESAPKSIGLESFDSYIQDNKFVLHLSEDVYDDYKHDTAGFEKAFKLTTSHRTTNMCCFDDEGSIKKYNTIGDIIEAFYEPRLAAYSERKRVQLDELNKEIRELSAKQVFIKAILEDRLKLIKASDTSIVKQLKELELPALSRLDEPDSVDGYEYLLRMRIDRVKATAVEDLMKQVADKTAVHDCLAAKQPSDLWLNDLDDFETAWEKYSAARTAEMESAPPKDTAAKKKIVKRNK
jgi:DNA topoisomerase-2